MDHFKTQSEGNQDFKIILPEQENVDLSTCVRNVFKKRKIECLPSVLLVERKNEFCINIEENLQYENAVWHCKFIRTSLSTFFRTKEGFCEVGEVNVEKRKHFPNVLEAVFELSYKQSLQILETKKSHFIYSGMEDNHKIRDCTVARKKERHLDTDKRRQHNNEERHKDTEHCKDLRIDP